MSTWQTNGELNTVDDAIHQLPGTTSVTLQKDNQTTNGKVVTKDNQILVNDGTNDRILIGFDPNGF